MMLTVLERVRVVQVELEGERCYRTDGLGRILHPELAVCGLPLDVAQTVFDSIVARIDQGEYLDIPRGILTVQDCTFQYEWRPRHFLFLFQEASHPRI